MELSFEINRANANALNTHFLECDSQFIPRLSDRVDLASYSAKLVTHAERFEAWSGNRLIGLVAAYANAPVQQCVFITNVSVTPDSHGQGIARRLLSTLINYARDAAFLRVTLKVDSRNARALALYRALEFFQVAVDGTEIDMTFNLEA